MGDAAHLVSAVMAHGEPPCIKFGRCTHYDACAGRELACKSFMMWTRGRRPRPPTEPSHVLFKKVFVEIDVEHAKPKRAPPRIPEHQTPEAIAQRRQQLLARIYALPPQQGLKQMALALGIVPQHLYMRRRESAEIHAATTARLPPAAAKPLTTEQRIAAITQRQPTLGALCKAAGIGRSTLRDAMERNHELAAAVRALVVRRPNANAVGRHANQHG